MDILALAAAGLAFLLFGYAVLHRTHPYVIIFIAAGLAAFVASWIFQEVAITTQTVTNR